METPEQVTTRMENLRSKRKPAKYKNVHPFVLAKPDSDTYSFKNIKEWIKESKEQVSAFNRASKGFKISLLEKQKNKAAADDKKAYIRMCEHYLKRGDWISMFSGKNEEHKVVPKVVAMAYDSDRNIKRTIGYWYPDIKAIWTKEMDELSWYGEDGSFGSGNVMRLAYESKLRALTDKQFEAK
jgi:hypothetical protein